MGFTWLAAGIEKLVSPAWWSGVALKGFWAFASAPPKGSSPAVAYEWYRQLLTFMLQNHWYVWFTYVVMFGELLIGLGLLLGALTGIAAFFGSLLNFSFGVGGPADLWLSIETRQELHDLVSLCAQQDWPLLMVGEGSNITAGNRQLTTVSQKDQV